MKPSKSVFLILSDIQDQTLISRHFETYHSILSIFHTRHGIFYLYSKYHANLTYLMVNLLDQNTENRSRTSNKPISAVFNLSDQLLVLCDAYNSGAIMWKLFQNTIISRRNWSTICYSNKKNHSNTYFNIESNPVLDHAMSHE